MIEALAMSPTIRVDGQQRETEPNNVPLHQSPLL